MELHNVGRVEEAIEIYERAATSHPPSADAFHLLAVAFFSQGDFRSTEANARRALFMQPRDINFHNTLGEIMRRGNPRLDQALVHFNEASSFQRA